MDEILFLEGEIAESESNENIRVYKSDLVALTNHAKGSMTDDQFLHEKDQYQYELLKTEVNAIRAYKDPHV